MTSDQDNDEEENAVFRKAMAEDDKREKKYRQYHHKPVDDRLHSSVSLPPKKLLGRTDTPQDIDDPVGPSEPILFVRPGLQKKAIKRLKSGECRIEARLNLRGHTKFEASGMLEEFIADALEDAMTCVLIIHGKGYNSKNNEGVLKQLTPKWLREFSAVKAFCSAQPKHGGTGAVYVLLKTSARR